MLFGHSFRELEAEEALTSSLDSELELSSWPHLRETTPVKEGDTLTQLEQDMDG